MRGIRGVLSCAVCCLWVLSCASWQRTMYYRSGTRALEQGLYQEALTDLSRAAAYVDNPVQASKVRNHIGLAYLGLGRRDLALQAFREAVELDCGNRAAQFNLSAVLEEGEVRHEP